MVWSFIDLDTINCRTSSANANIMEHMNPNIFPSFHAKSAVIFPLHKTHVFRF